MNPQTETTRSVPIVRAKGLVKQYDDHVVIPGIDFEVADIEGKSEVIAILGPSGCGKSTILRMIAGLEMPSAGILECCGSPVIGPGLDRGMVFQKYSSFPFLNTLQNVAYPLIHVKKMKPHEAHDLAMDWCQRMHLEKALEKFPHQLSGGMQQRVAIARSLAMQARIVLMDEPFGALDRKIRWEMQDLMAELTFIKPAHEFTVFLVTHDIPEAVYLGDRVWLLHQGRISLSKEVGRPTEPARIAQGRKDFVEMTTWFNDELGKLEL